VARVSPPLAARAGALVELVSEQLAAHGIEQAVREAYG